ncbi:LOW QUALITY PROTEIN: uncharacterized protein [Amphiura filiformis]|uniref:LOW QUALITY PROTEIN: uncharacterized protein n=1 Tax=Amphiura filiformis TaxID=82378 RepID=UPI003B2235C9
MAAPTAASSDSETKHVCAMHVVPGTTSDFLRFSEKSWSKYISCAERWVKLVDREEHKVAQNAGEVLGVEFDSSAVRTVDYRFPDAESKNMHIGFHSDCRRRFCDVSKIDLAEQGVERAAQKRIQPPQVQVQMFKILVKAREAAQSPRSSSTVIAHVLPQISIICCKKDKWLKHQGKTVRDKYSKCETYSAGRLLEAARQKEDERILLHVEGKDLIAIEVRYHQSCYKDYVRFLTREERKDDGESPFYNKAYNVLCEEVIKKRLKGKQMMLLRNIKAKFIKLVKSLEGKECGTSSSRLKQRLKKTFPQLVFQTPHMHNMSDIVYCETLATAGVAEDAVDSDTDTTGTDDTDTDTDANEGEDQQPRHLASKQPNLHTLYTTALDLKTIMKQPNIAKLPWPPSTSDVTLSRSEEIVPTPLYNFLAWSTGLSDDPKGRFRVEVDPDGHRKLLSVSQDLLYLSSRGKFVTPKHASLTMAVRHLTGSAQLIGILNGLGHCTSNSSVLEHDTALAKQQLKLGDHPIPPDIHPSTFTTLVWDNIDFGEETLSGKGTTHSTSGIIIQRSRYDSSHSQPSPGNPTSQKKTRERTLEAPPSNIVPYFGGRNQGPRVPLGNVNIENMHYRQQQKPASRIDSAYFMLRGNPNLVYWLNGF